jgi:hypothetical protein
MTEVSEKEEVLEILKALAEELYFRAAAARFREERAALKGVQHAIERVLEKYKCATFERKAQYSGQPQREQ